MTSAAGFDLTQLLSELNLWGQLRDLDDPKRMNGSMEAIPEEGALYVEALKGERGPAGPGAVPVKMQWSKSIRDVNELPLNYLDDPADRGKAFWLGNNVHVWLGKRWEVVPMGAAGPRGPVPRIEPKVTVLDPYGIEDTNIQVGGDDPAFPTWKLRLRPPPGPPGKSHAIRDGLDYDRSTAQEIAHVLTVVADPAVPGGMLWAPRTYHGRHVKMYSVPEAAFGDISAGKPSYLGWTQGKVIGQYVVEPQPYDWVPFCLGHMKAIGVELDVTPLQMGVWVRLGGLGGTLVGRGHGSPLGWTTLAPHFSTPGVDTFVSPTNGHAVTPAGQEATITVSLQSEGIGGLYYFHRNGSQLTILCVPTELVYS